MFFLVSGAGLFVLGSPRTMLPVARKVLRLALLHSSGRTWEVRGTHPAHMLLLVPLVQRRLAVYQPGTDGI